MILDLEWYPGAIRFLSRMFSSRMFPGRMPIELASKCSAIGYGEEALVLSDICLTLAHIVMVLTGARVCPDRDLTLL